MCDVGGKFHHIIDFGIVGSNITIISNRQHTVDTSSVKVSYC